jgi:hypothetical protein
VIKSKRSQEKLGRVLLSEDKDDKSELDHDDISDVPEEIETALEELFRALQDKVLIVFLSG